MKTDPELEQVIEESIANSRDYLEALDKVIEFKKEKRGLHAMHISPSLDMFLGKDHAIDPGEEANKMAHDVLMMELSGARGQWKEVNGEELDRM